MEGSYDRPNKNPYFFVTTEPNRMGFSGDGVSVDGVFSPEKNDTKISHFG